MNFRQVRAFQPVPYNQQLLQNMIFFDTDCNPNVSSDPTMKLKFAPQSGGINITGDIGTGAVSLTGGGDCKGADIGIDLKIPQGGGGTPGAMLLIL